MHQRAANKRVEGVFVEHDAAGDESVGTATPIYFGTSSRPLFGWLHRPAGAWSGACVVLCSALGYEGLFAHPALRALAQQLADAAQAIVLRFDYDGVGDSAGSDEDPRRVAAWLDSIDMAVDAVTRQAPDRGSVILVGLRAGAALATAAAARRSDIAGLVLWAPCLSGKDFAREQRAFALLAHATAAGPNDESIDWGKGGFEANGYVFTAETVTALGQLSINACQTSPSPRVLVLDREESPCKDDVFHRWRDAGAQIDHVVIDDYAAMIEPPLTMKLPRASLDIVTDWVGRPPSVGARRSVAREVVGREVAEAPHARIAPGVIEEPVWYDGHQRFGILTLPEGHQPDRVMVFLNNAGGNRVGPHGMVPMMARQLATQNVASLRIDVGGVGDSERPSGRPPHHPYDLVAVDDVRVAVAFLRERGFTQIAAGGLCSAAFLAWHTAQSASEIAQLVLINPQTFEWTEGDSLAVSPLQQHYEFESYRQSFRSAEKWKKLARGDVDIAHVAALLWDRLLFATNSRLQSMRVAVGVGNADSRASRLVRKLGQRGGRVSVIFSSGDPGIPNLARELGGAMRGFLRKGVLSVEVIDGPDHSFTPRWATRRLSDAIVREFGRPNESAHRG